MPNRLTGARIAVTRARAQAEELAAPLRDEGAEVVIAPLIAIAPIDSAEVREAVGNLDRYDWVVFSSANGVDLFMEAARRDDLADRVAKTVRVACVGPATAAAAARHGLATALMPAEYVGESLAQALSGHVRGARVLLARAAGARAQLARHLQEAGAQVTDLELYRSVPDLEGARVLREGIATGALDVLTFTASSTIRYFAEAVGRPGRAVIAVIGPITADSARRYGLTVTIEAHPHTTQGLVDGILEHFDRVKLRGTED